MSRGSFRRDNSSSRVSKSDLTIRGDTWMRSGTVDQDEALQKDHSGTGTSSWPLDRSTGPHARVEPPGTELDPGGRLSDRLAPSRDGAILGRRVPERPIKRGHCPRPEFDARWNPVPHAN